MNLLSNVIKKTKPRLCKVDDKYLRYMHKCDNRISVKYNNRPFVVLVVEINGFLYAVPLTSQTTSERIKRGKKKRSHRTTTFIYNKNEEIANLLHNNMFPVPDTSLSDIIIDPITMSYEANEERFMRKNWVDINLKSIDVYTDRYNPECRDFQFLSKICCDFKYLETKCSEWIDQHNKSIRI